MIVLFRVPARADRLRSSVAAVGVFDGVHRGHQAILARAVARARAVRATPVAVTFHPHPVSVLRPGTALPLLLGLEGRLRRIASTGIRLTLVVRFTRALSQLSPEEFVRRVLVEGLRAREVVVGHDFGFGAGRGGTVATLRAMGERFGFRTHVIPPVRLGRWRISSGRIRRLIAEGRLAAAEHLLGRPVSVVGKVVRGTGRGKALGFPTANLRITSGVLPRGGVYAVRARVVSWYPGMANIGFRPTFRGRSTKGHSTGHSSRTECPPMERPLLEVHLFGVRRSLYGRALEVEFRRRLRPERRFPSAGALRRQLGRDVLRARGRFTREKRGGRFVTS